MKQQKKIKSKALLLAMIFVLFVWSARIVFANNSSTSSAETQENEATSTIDNIKKVIQEKKTELGTVGANVRAQRAYLAKVMRVSQ